MARFISIITFINGGVSKTRNMLGYLRTKWASLHIAVRIASVTAIIPITVFVINYWHTEKIRKQDEIERRFNDLKRDLFSDNLSLVSIAVENLAKEFGGVLDNDKDKIKYISLAYELLGKRFASLAPDKISNNIIEDSRWTGELKKLCGKIVLYTAYFPPTVDSIAPWHIQGKYFRGLNIRRTYSESSGILSEDFDPSVVDMLNETHSRPHLMYALINDCDFSQAELIMVNLSESRIENTSFYGTKFMACTLNFVFLQNCDFRNSSLTGSYLRPSMMLGTDLRGALIDSAVFFGIDPAFYTASPGYSDSTILWWDSYSKKVVIIKGQYKRTVYK